MGPDVVVLAVTFQVPPHLPMGQEAAQLGVEGEVREHHHLLGQVGSVRGREEVSRLQAALRRRVASGERRRT